VESKIAIELLNTYQTYAKQMSYNLYQTTNAKYQMVNNRKRTEASGQHILSLNENKIKASERVKSEMNRVRTQPSIVPLAVLQTD